MGTRATLVAAALEVLEREGEARFSTRAVCAIAEVGAPTLYHHFGNADGLLSAAFAEAFRQLVARKQAGPTSADPRVALSDGWDDYVSFAAEHPRLYAAMMARVLQGADIPAAEQVYALLREQIAAFDAACGLVMEQHDAAQVVWASSNSAAMLHATAAMDTTAKMKPPSRTLINSLRERTMQMISRSDFRKEDA